MFTIFPVVKMNIFGLVTYHHDICTWYFCIVCTKLSTFILKNMDLRKERHLLFSISQSVRFVAQESNVLCICRVMVAHTAHAFFFNRHFRVPSLLIFQIFPNCYTFLWTPHIFCLSFSIATCVSYLIGNRCLHVIILFF